MAPVKRKSYAAAFKFAAIQKAVSVGNRAAVREYGVERCIWRWKAEKEDLTKMPKMIRTQRSGTVAWPTLEQNLSK